MNKINQEPITEICVNYQVLALAMTSVLVQVQVQVQALALALDLDFVLIKPRCVFWLNLRLRVLPVQKCSECSE